MSSLASSRHFYTFSTLERRAVPYVCETYGAIKLRTHQLPFFRGHWPFAVSRIVGFSCGISMNISVFSHQPKHLRRREIPKMIFRKVFSNCNVFNAACFVGFLHRQSCPLPLPNQPVLKIKAIDGRVKDVLGADFCHNRKPANFSSVHIASNMRFAFIPDVGVNVSPSIFLQNWMNISPPNLRIPKP